MNFSRLVIFGLKENEEFHQAVTTVKQWSESRAIEVETTKTKEKLRQALTDAREPLILTLGGDGTFLKAADSTAGFSVPLLGVNLGSLGFLASVQLPQLTSSLEKATKGETHRRKLMRLKGSGFCKGANGGQTVLNEFFFTRPSVTGFVELQLEIDNEVVGDYPGDGIIVSTPTGSTAYSLGAGGPLITPGTQAISICPLGIHKLGTKPIICSAESEVKITPKNDCLVVGDGDAQGSIVAGDIFSVTRSERTTEVLLPQDHDGFFTVVKDKLTW